MPFQLVGMQYFKRLWSTQLDGVNQTPIWLVMATLEGRV